MRPSRAERRTVDNSQRIRAGEVAALQSVGCERVTVLYNMRKVTLVMRDAGAARAKAFLVCPGCNSRRIHLYEHSGGYVCRVCAGLGYRTEYMTDRQRAFLRATRIYQRLLGERPFDMSRFPPRPKGMWRRTHERLRREAEDALARAGVED